MVEAILRPYDLGGTQWYLLQKLVTEGQLEQRAIAGLLHVERATASGVVLALVRKGLAEQVESPADRRQKLVRLTDAGGQLWSRLPDPIGLTHKIAFAGISEEDMTTAVRVLSIATEQLEASRLTRSIT